MTSADGRRGRAQDDDDLTIDGLAALGVKPITSVSELGRPNRWESDDGYQASLADLCASRRAGPA